MRPATAAASLQHHMPTAAHSSNSSFNSCNSSFNSSNSSSMTKRTVKKHQTRIDDLRKVVCLPKSHGCADTAELRRLLAALKEPDDEEVLITALRQLSCYRLGLQQLEEVPLGRQVMRLRQHPSKAVGRLAASVVQKLRGDITNEPVGRQKTKGQSKRAG